MRKWSNLPRVGLSLLLATVILSGCVVSPYPAHYDGAVAAPRPYYYHPYYSHPYDYGYRGYHGYSGYGWGGHDHW